MDALFLGKYDDADTGQRDVKMKNWLKKMRF